MNKIFHKIINFTNAMENWKMELTESTAYEGKNPNRHLPSGLAFTATVCYSNVLPFVCC